LDKNAVVDALDRAVANTIADELSYFRQKPSEEAVTTQLSRARREILKLGETGTPDYNNDLVPAVYLAAYQLQHINLTYSLINDMLHARDPGNSRLSPNGRLQVVDFGAGALAMQFGLTLALADALEMGQNIEAVHVDSMDQSEQMLLVGMAMWEKFANIAKADKTGRLRTVRQACQMVDYQPHTSIETIKAKESYVSWLSAIHAVYEDTGPDVIRDLYRRLSPVAGFITCAGNHDLRSLTGERLWEGNIDIARNISPFQSNQYLRRLISGHVSKNGSDASHALVGELSETLGPRTTEVNRELRLIDAPGTWRTQRAVLNWTYNTAFFTYARADTVNSSSSFRRYQATPIRTARSPHSYRGIPDDIDDLPF
jgi:hypothetical protein